MNRSFLVGAFALLVLSACSDGNGDAPADAPSDDRVEASVTDANAPPADVPADEAPVTDTGSAPEDHTVPLPDVPAPEDIASLDAATPEDVAPPDTTSEPDVMTAPVDVVMAPDSAPTDTGAMIVDAGCERAMWRDVLLARRVRGMRQRRLRHGRVDVRLRGGLLQPDALQPRDGIPVARG